MDLVFIKEEYFSDPLLLKSGLKIFNYKLVYETYGKLNLDKSNVILICHALNASHHVTGKYKKNIEYSGWWNNMVGPNKTINTNIFFIICINNIGSCFGSTGPMNINFKTGYLYGSNFPILTIEDWVNSQFFLMKKLKIKKIFNVIGASLGGMQVLCWNLIYPNFSKNYIIIASTLKLSAQNISFNSITRQSINFDYYFFNGDFYYYGLIPKNSLCISRMIAHNTYISSFDMSKKFNRKLQFENVCFNFDMDFKVESYLYYQGEKFSNYFDTNTYLLITKLLDYFDMDKKIKKKNKKKNFLIISFNTDWRFPLKHNKKIINLLIKSKMNIYFIKINSLYGHDAFLKYNYNYMQVINFFLKRNYKNIFLKKYNIYNNI
ncbi:homoserine O-acetyltransferase MetX [Candidatus Zinderia endosymbiont of Aphrophora alni]|uniref:homoserine O-acetyltransferase MetX n=1 Tax=Candidatus Zinderia endosymbiont of Aphrophora alni TaxID=3077951 RepID=UPI0030D246FF